MLDSTSLRQALKTILGIEDRYLVPLDAGWYVPTYDKADTVGTWVGYRILNKQAAVRTFTGYGKDGPSKIKNIKVTFRISFVGPQAEELCDQTIMWDDRTDVQEAFEKANAQINYTDRNAFSYPVKNGGLNDNVCWCVDFSAMTFFEVPTNWKPWNISGARLGGDIITP